MYFDVTYILILIGVAICSWASSRVQTTFRKYSGMRSMSGLTGAEAAARILQRAGIDDVRISGTHGTLSDHYDPRRRMVYLSDLVYGQSSVSAVSVAAHECGHVIQHHIGYIPLNIRTAIVPIVSFGSQISWPLFFIGLMLNGNIGGFLMEAGILLFLAALAFQIITLPVEFDASRRALRILEDTGMLREDELPYAKKVLRAAAFTYVAAVLLSFLQLLRLLLLSNRRRD